jgi:hypothetical protein
MKRVIVGAVIALMLLNGCGTRLIVDSGGIGTEAAAMIAEAAKNTQ